jgi:quercetin dioxygenase-like cupin family protein
MSLPASTPLKIGDVAGVLMIFEKANDVLPMHSHGDSDVHFTAVIKGSFECCGPSFPAETYRSGAIVDWAAGTEHEFKALEDDSRLLNIVKKFKA